MQNVLNIACHIQCPINLHFFDAAAWARRLEIQGIIMYLRGLQNTQRPLVPSRWSLGVLIQGEIVSSSSSTQFPALLDERVFEESNLLPMASFQPQVVKKPSLISHSFSATSSVYFSLSHLSFWERQWLFTCMPMALGSPLRKSYHSPLSLPSGLFLSFVERWSQSKGLSFIHIL